MALTTNEDPHYLWMSHAMHQMPSPLTLLIEFDNYSGSWGYLSQKKPAIWLFLLFGVLPSSSITERSAVLVVAAYAMSVQKTWSLSLDRVVVNINERERQGLC